MTPLLRDRSIVRIEVYFGEGSYRVRMGHGRNFKRGPDVLTPERAVEQLVKMFKEELEEAMDIHSDTSELKPL